MSDTDELLRHKQYRSDMEHVATLLYTYKYVIILPIAIIEGPLLGMAAGFVIKLGYLNVWITALLLMVGDLIDDVIWYSVGYYGGRPLVEKIGKYFGVSKKKLDMVNGNYRQHYIIILFLSKITSGFGLAVPIVAASGIAQVSFWKYMLVNIVGQPIWTGLLLALGYYFGEFYMTVAHSFGWLTFVPIVIVIGVGVWGFFRYINRRLYNKNI